MIAVLISEPGLFEWLAWYQDGMPDWMSGEELARAGYNIQLAYKPYISADELQEATESCQQFYIRNFFVTQCALQVKMFKLRVAIARILLVLYFWYVLYNKIPKFNHFEF